MKASAARAAGTGAQTTAKTTTKTTAKALAKAASKNAVTKDAPAKEKNGGAADENNVRAAGRTLDLFEAFATIRRPMTISELSRALKIPVSSCFSLIRTLEARGYLYSLPPGSSYYPTNRMRYAAETISRSDPVLSVVGDTLRQLRDQTGETIIFGKLSRNKVVLLAVELTQSPTRYLPQVGDMRPLHATSVGKALLGAMSDEHLDKMLAQLTLDAITPKTIVDPVKLKKEIIASRARGWYTNTEENVAEMMTAGMPLQIRGENYAISVSAPTARIKANLEGIVGALDAAVRSIAN